MPEPKGEANMRLDISIVADTRADFITVLHDLIRRLRNHTEHSNEYDPMNDKDYELDYQFTDFNDVHEDNSKAKICHLPDNRTAGPIFPIG